MIIQKSTKQGSYHKFPYFLFSMALMMPCTFASPLPALSNNTSPYTVSDSEDKATTSQIPQKVSELEGKEITFANYPTYTSVERPWENDKMLLLYNVGTGKFLNVGSYWGTHATLSEVPRPFWFQRRNEAIQDGIYAYKRYPTSKVSDLDFCDELAALNTVQIGANYQHDGNGTSSNQSATYSNAKYEYIKVIGTGDDASTNGTSLCDANYEPNGDGFSYNQDIDWSKQKIVARIDLSGVNAVYHTGGEGTLETVFSVGEDITKWDMAVPDVHIYASKDAEGKMEVRVQCINKHYSDQTQKTILKAADNQLPSNNIIDVEISSSSIMVAGHECMPARQSLSTENPISAIFNQKEMQVGSAEGSVRSNATYNYVKIFTNETQTIGDTCVVKPGLMAGGQTFCTQKDGNLQIWGINADIDLATCTGDNENVLSIGTDITEKGSSYNNLYFYYNASTHKLTLQYANSAASDKVQTMDIASVDASNQTLKVYLDGNGLVVNGTTMDDVNDVVANLGKNEMASSIQVGSIDTNNPSHATYHNLSIAHSYPQANEAWNGKRFMKKIDGNLSNWNMEWTLDLSTCKNAGENVLSIGTDIYSWIGTKGDADNIHIYYTPSTKLLQIEAVNSTYKGNQNHQEKTLTNDELKSLKIMLTTDGLYVNDEQIYSSSNAIVKALSGCTYLQVGSEEGNAASHATYVSETVKPTGKDVNKLGDFPEAGNEWDGKKFMKEYEGNLSNWELEYTLDLSTCLNENENVLSIGEAIDQWKGNCIHIYYKPSTKKLEIDPVTSTNGNAVGGTTQALTDEKSVTIKLSKRGLYLNGTRIIPNSNKVIDYLLNTATKLQVGSEEGSNRSHATYKSLSVSEVQPLPEFPIAGTQWDGATKFVKDFDGNLSTKVIEAEIDVTESSNAENVLSIGTDIAYWGNDPGAKSDACNIHFYYPKNGKLAIDIVGNNYTGGTKFTSDNSIAASGNKLTIKLSKDGLVVNGTTINMSSGVAKHVLDYLTNTATSLQVGSMEGSSRSNATYDKLDITDASSAKQLAAKKTTLAAASSTTTSSTYYIPYENMTADGNTAFHTEAYTLDWDKGDYIEAEIDITNTPTVGANIFSIGTDVTQWGATSDNNLHIYYRGKEGDNAMMRAEFVNQTNPNGLKKFFMVKPNADGKLIMHVKLDKEHGLMVNDIPVYYSAQDDPMPVIAYDERYAGEIIKFKHDANGNPVLENGKYVPVKPGEDGYDTAKPIREATTDYIWTNEDRDSGEMPVFITSRFRLQSTASQNEGFFFSWSPYYKSGNDKWGSVGVFADRSLPQRDFSVELSQMASEWHFKPVDGMKNTYQIYLSMSDVEVPYRDTSKPNNFEFRQESGNFYLQATDEHVYGNYLEDYGGGYNETKDGNAYDGVEALTFEPTGDKAAYSYWRVFDVEEYYSLFEAQNSEMSVKVNLSYTMRDPDFARESEELSNWKVDATMQNQVRVGFDQYTKKWNTTTGSFSRDYTDDNGTTSSAFYIYSNNHVYNHGRYMGVEVKNGGYGKFYQEGLSIHNPGWYVITCSGLSNIGAKLFATYKEHTLEQPLHKVTDKEIAYFNATDKVWPYDQNGSTAMPLYNALVAMNDENADNSSIDGENATDENKLYNKLQTQVAFYVSQEDLKNASGSLNVTFGVDIPNDSEVASDDQWTVFDNFLLLYGGDNAEDPNLVLDEDFTDLGYLDRSMHIFQDRPMRLHRTFDPDTWNTLVLPVSLTKDQFHELLKDNEARLLKIKEIKGTKLIFTPEVETEAGTTNEDGTAKKYYLRANKPYLVKTSKAQGQQPEYTAHIFHWADGGQTSEYVKCPDNHFVAYGVTLEPENWDRNNGKTLYDFANAEKYKTIIGDTKYDYVVNLGDEDIANDADGKGRTATFYGTLCKTFDFDENGNGYFLSGRPTLGDGKSYYMKSGGGNNFYYKKSGRVGLLGFRCWFVYDEPQVTSSKYSIEINGITDDATNIETIETANGMETIAQYKGAIYNLNGQKVAESKKLEELPAGIYIVNGKKYIINK